MPKTSSFFSPGAEKVNQRSQAVKCGSDDSGQDASWKPDDDEMAGEMDDDEDVTSDGKSTPEEQESGKPRNERRNDIPSKRGIDRKGGSGRRNCPTPNQDWKDNRKSMKGLRELTALIDGSAQLRESNRRTRRQPVSNQRKFQNGNGHDGRLDGEYASCSSGDSSWSNRSGSSILGGSPRNERNRLETMKPTFRSPIKLQERPHPSHINNTFERPLCTEKTLSKGFSEDVNRSQVLDNCPTITSGRSGINTDNPLPSFNACDGQNEDMSRDMNPSKRQRLGSPTKVYDPGGSGQLDDNTDDFNEPWGAGMSDLCCGDPKERTANGKQTDGYETSKRSHTGFKIKNPPMIKHENAWYRARILETDGDRLFVEFTGFEDGSLAKPFWIREDSDRIWKGSYRGKDWKHLGDGAWMPKPPSTKHKKKLKGLKRGKKTGQVDADHHNSQQVITRVKDSTDQVVSQGDGTNMETDDMGPHQNSNNEGEGANVGTSRAPQEPTEVTQKLGPVEVKREAPSSSSKGPKLPRPPRRTMMADARPDYRDSGAYPRGHHQSLEHNDGNNFLGTRPSLAEENESQNRNMDAPSESGGSHMDRKGEKRICKRSDRTVHEPTMDRSKMKSCLGVLSEGVGSAGDSQGSQACPLKKSHFKLRTGGGPYDDTVFSSPSSDSPLSHIKPAMKSSKGSMEVKVDNSDVSNKNNHPSDQADAVLETADAGKLGWKIGWKRHVKGEHRSSDDREDPEDPDAAQQQLTPKASTSQQREDCTLKPSFTGPANSNMGDMRNRKNEEEGQGYQDVDAKTHQDVREFAGDKGPGGRRSSKRNDRSRTAAKLRNKSVMDDETTTDQDAGVALGPVLMPSFPKSKSTFVHIRKHLPYYNEHIPDQKLEAYVEMMERLDSVPGANLSPDCTGKDVAVDHVDNMTLSTSKQPQAPGLAVSGPNHHLNHIVPVPAAQAQTQSQNVQVPLPWAAFNPLFYPSVMQFPLSSGWPHQNQQPHLQAQQIVQPAEPQTPLNFNQQRGVGGGNQGR